MSTTETTPSTTTLPSGTWSVDPATSELGFAARGMFGLANVRGTFGEYKGTLYVDDAGSRGDIRIGAASLDTGNKKRDEHLRSPDFFAAEAHPTVTFVLNGITPAADGEPTLVGELHIRDNALALTAPLHVKTVGPDRLELATTLSVDRAAAGVGWSKFGMIKGDAHLHATLVLYRVGD